MKKFLMPALFVGSLSLMGANYAEAAGGCCCQAAPVYSTAPTATAQAPQAGRSYSYEPTMVPARTYYPTRRYSSQPGWLLPKSDPRKFSVN